MQLNKKLYEQKAFVKKHRYYKITEITERKKKVKKKLQLTCSKQKI